MAEFFLDPKGFEEQMKNIKDGGDKIKAVKYSMDQQKLALQSVEKYQECIDAFNDTVILFGQMLDKEVHNMKMIKAKWMGLEGDIAGTLTLGELLFGERK